MRYFIVIVSTVLFLTTLTEAQRQGDLCVMAGTIQPGVCRHIMRCSPVLEAAFHGLPYQVCASPENRLIVCCPWVPRQETRLQDRCQANTTTPREGDNCTMMDTGKAGVCSRFSNCQTAKEAAYKGVSPQICAVEGTLQIVCCPLVKVAEGDRCSIAETGRVGKCLRISKCPVAVEAALKGITPQICALDGSVPVVCCEGVVEGDKCTRMDTGKAGVCIRIANCQIAIEASSKGISPQTCDVEGTVQVVCCPLLAVAEGSNCTLKDTGKSGVCKPFSNCQSAKEAANKGVFPQKCDLTDNESELVCCGKTACPPLPKGLVTQLPIGSKAADYCIELAEKIHPCQETRSGWSRGDMCPLLTQDSNIEYHNTPMTTAAEAPYYGHIGLGQRENIIWNAAAVSLVSDQWVLCSNTEWIRSSNVHVGLGGTFSPRYNPDQIYGVTKQLNHPLYNSIFSKAYNNIALLRLDRQVTFTSRILPACLHTGTPLPDSGFIRTGSVPPSKTDYKTSMQRVSQEECSRVFPAGSRSHPEGIKHNTEICSRPVNTTGECTNWYTGTLLTLPNSLRVVCTHLLVGLGTTQNISPCTYTNTRIPDFIPWIEGIVWPESGVVV